ncbi:Cysteine-rich receptor-like protein kinase 25, partial [Cucurbita argyrosperma subsp. sororia]
MLNFVTFLFILCFLIHGNAQTPVSYPYRSCLPGNFTQNSTYHSNLDLLFSNLSANGPPKNRFFNTSAGRPPNDAVYGLFQCRGDVSDSVCRSFLATAIKDVAQEYCPLRKGAVAWYDECIFRYSDQRFFSDVSTEPSLPLLNSAEIDVDKARFNQLVMSMLRATAARAANASVGELFATQEANFTSDLPLYTLAQCTGDLSNTDCELCLRQAINGIPSCCSNKRGGRVLFPSCYVRYEVYMFYEQTPTNSVPPPATTPPNNTTPTPPLPPPPTPGKRRISTMLIVAIVAPITISILLFVLGCCFLRQRARNRHSSIKEDSVVNEMTTMESLQFDFKTIDAATNKFSEENKLGEGGFGVVFKQFSHFAIAGRASVLHAYFPIHGSAEVYPDPFRYCSNATFSPNSTYLSNLQILSSTLSSNASHNFYHNSSVGRQKSPNSTAVYGDFQCRGDLNATACRQCVATATANSTQSYCPRSVEAVIWLDECLLRYSNESFFSIVAERPMLILINNNAIEEDESGFDRIVGSALNHTVANASSVEGALKFATKEANFKDAIVYTLAQCTGDLSTSNCGKCLRGALRNYPGCCSGKKGGRVLSPSCMIRYELYPFYGGVSPSNAISTPPASAPASAPALLPPPESSPDSNAPTSEPPPPPTASVSAPPPPLSSSPPAPAPSTASPPLLSGNGRATVGMVMGIVVAGFLLWSL